MNISVLVLSLNEEFNLPACLQSVSWSDDIVVLDDGSTDRTVDIARQNAVRVICHSAGNEKDQRTYALHSIDYKHSWTYNPDADELTPSELRDEMLAAVADPSRAEVAYRVRFKFMFMGRWLRHSSLYPTWVIRLFRPERLSFERETNLRYVVDGPVGMLHSHFLHYSFQKGLAAWRAKHIRYAAFEAAETLKSLRSGKIDWAGVLAFGDPVRRRRALKVLSFRLPGRPFLRFIYMYLIRLGFLDGWPGLRYCRLLAWYESMIVQKIKELRRQARTRPLEGKP